MCFWFAFSQPFMILSIFHVAASHTYVFWRTTATVYPIMHFLKTPIYVCLHNIKTNEKNYKMEQRKQSGIFLNYKAFKLPRKPYRVIWKWTTIRCKYIVQTPAQLHYRKMKGKKYTWYANKEEKMQSYKILH